MPEGLPDFHGLLGRDGQRTACLYAFDLLHLRATDLRPVELVGRRAMLKKLIPKGIGESTTLSPSCIPRASRVSNAKARAVCW